MMDATQAALRVLVVEDEPMIAMMVEDTIVDMGFTVVGPVAQLDDALRLAAEGEFDCAILDVNLRGENSFAVADLLTRTGCPFTMATGYSDQTMPSHLLNQKKLAKPYSTRELEFELLLLSAQVTARR